MNESVVMLPQVLKSIVSVRLCDQTPMCLSE